MVKHLDLKALASQLLLALAQILMQQPLRGLQRMKTQVLVMPSLEGPSARAPNQQRGASQRPRQLIKRLPPLLQLRVGALRAGGHVGFIHRALAVRTSSTHRYSALDPRPHTRAYVCRIARFRPLGIPRNGMRFCSEVVSCKKCSSA